MKAQGYGVGTASAVLGLLCWTAGAAQGSGIGSAGANANGLSYFVQGGTVLPNESVSDWWYGCSPTAAGMIMGYYDRNGYAGLSYANVVPGGVAEPSVVGFNDPIPLLKKAIASEGHQRDFYSALTYGYNTGGGEAYLASGDDLPISHSFNSLADFMGTSQDSVGNVNGSTTFYYYPDGTRLTADILDGYTVSDGMTGIRDYLAYSGYGINPATIYTQLIQGYGGASSGFTWEQYKAEIDTGRPMIIQVEGHSMMGYGYDESGGTRTIKMHNTWDASVAEMQWGGSYSGMNMWGVVGFELSGGTPTPDAGASFLLLSLACSGLVLYRRHR